MNEGFIVLGGLTIIFGLISELTNLTPNLIAYGVGIIVGALLWRV